MLYIGGTLTVLLCASFTILILLSYSDIKSNLDFQISSNTESITTQVSDLINTSARSYLMGVGSSVSEISDFFIKSDNYSNLNKRVLDFYNSCVSITFLKSGSIFLTNSKGIIIAHSNSSLVGTISPMLSWIQRLKADEKTFKEYEEANKNKLVFRIYDKNFNVNVCITASTSDFINAIDLKELNKSMNNLKIGKTGYPFLLSYSGEVITHPNKKLINNQGLSLIKEIISTKNGFINYTWVDENRVKRDKYVNYKNVKNSEIIVAVTGYIDEVYSALYNQVKLIIIFGTIVIFIVLILISFVSKTVTTPLGFFTNKIAEISEGKGDLTNRIEVKSSDEVSKMGVHFNSFLDNLQQMINSIKKSSLHTIEIKNKILSDVEESSNAIKKIGLNISNIDSKTEDLYKNVENSANSVNHIGDNITLLNESFDEQIKLFKITSEQIKLMITSIFSILEITNLKQETTKELVRRASEGDIVIGNTLAAVKNISLQLGGIKSMAQIINDLSTQTNLLSINAAIEAAHAGNSGKGFAVVADEINKLASSSSENSSKISETIKDIENTINLASSLSHDTSESFKLLNKEITDIVKAFDDINSSNTDLNRISNSVLKDIHSLNEHSQLVKSKVNHINEKSEEVRINMESTSGITNTLVDAMSEISSNVKHITYSMNKHIITTEKLECNGNELSRHINQFKS